MSLPLYKEPSFADRLHHWEAGEKSAEEKAPLKGLKVLPHMQGITPETKRNLKLKSLSYMLWHDKDHAIKKGVAKHPLRYSFQYLRSLFKKRSFERAQGADSDFFLYNTPSVDAFKASLQEKNTFFILGFSYCHKPFECPSGRFTTQCIQDPENSICRQCFIGKALHLMPRPESEGLVITTIHYIGAQIFRLKALHPTKRLLFIISACELTLQMFGDWGNMVGIEGLGVRLDGRICNTMRAFELSETGIKPGLTVVLPHTQQRIIELLRARHDYALLHF